MVSPPSDPSTVAAPGTAANRPAGAATPPDAKPDGPAAALPPDPDRADIRPLDLTRALQIVIAEVQAELTQVLLSIADAPAASNAGAGPGSAAGAVLPAARDIVESVLNSLPQSSREFAVWSEALPAIDHAVASGLARAAAIIEGWRDVRAPVVSAARDLRVLVTNALADEPLNPLWLRPEWLDLAPRLLRLRRRRKILQRRLTDPDYRTSFFDDPEPLG